MDRDSLPVVTETCLCGKGQIRIDVTIADNGWSINSSTHCSTTCRECADAYAFISHGRGIALVSTEYVRRVRELREHAQSKAVAFLQSAETASALDALAGQLENLPSAAAKYRLVHGLGLESATQSTFTRHIRGVAMREWLRWRFQNCGEVHVCLSRLAAVYDHLGHGTAQLKAYIAEVSALRANAAAVPQILKSWGPINLFAATSKAAEDAAAARRGEQPLILSFS